MNLCHRKALVDALRELESHLKELGAGGLAGSHRWSWASLSATTLLLRTHLGVGTTDDVLYPLFQAYVSEYLTLLGDLGNLPREL